MNKDKQKKAQKNLGKLDVNNTIHNDQHVRASAFTYYYRPNYTRKTKYAK